MPWATDGRHTQSLVTSLMRSNICRNFLALLALVPLQRFIPLHQQMLLPLGLTFAVLVLAAAVALWTKASGAAVILAMLPSVALMGMTTALLQGGLFGLAGLCPPIYVQVYDPHQCLHLHPRAMLQARCSCHVQKKLPYGIHRLIVLLMQVRLSSLRHMSRCTR